MRPRIPQPGALALSAAGAPRDSVGMTLRHHGPRGEHVTRPARRWRYRVLVASGLLLIAGVAAWQINASLWTARSHRIGQSLVRGFLHENNLASPLSDGVKPSGGVLVSCRLSSTQRTVRGLLEIPKLGVVAPVEQNMNDAQLNVAVGHNPYSVWPGETGTSVLVAHDVSYFENLPQLKVGDEVIYVAPCKTYYFRVESHSVVAAGAPVYNTPNPSVTLVTCWPTNALWYTPDRYVLSATFIGTRPTQAALTSYPGVTPPPAVPAPAALSSQGITLSTYSLPMGNFGLNGRPNPTWAQTTNPLLVQGSAVDSFIAAIRALNENRVDWWRQLAPGVAVPGPLLGAANPGYNAGLDVTVTAYGTTSTKVLLQDTLTTAGATYAVTVVQTIREHTLYISSWEMHPA
jgi:sortase A